jgi:4-azaleucine resistance transporter AzlC
MRALAPLLVGVAPFGMIYGVLALANGLTPLAALAMSSILFAGSAQFLFCQLLGVGAPATVIIAEVGLLNLRHVLYSAALAPRLAHLPRRWKWLLAYLLTDEAFAAISPTFTEVSSPNRHWFYFGAGLALWGGWQLSTAVGVLVGASLSTAWPLDFALPLTFIAIVVPLIRDRATLVTAISAGIVALLAVSLPFKLGLLMAALAGLAAGWWLIGTQE